MGYGFLANLSEYRRRSKRPAFHVAKQSISAIKSPIWRLRVRRKSLLDPCHGGTEQLNLLENISLRKNSIVFPPSEESPSLVPDRKEPLDGPSHQVGDLSMAYGGLWVPGEICGGFYKQSLAY